MSNTEALAQEAHEAQAITDEAAAGSQMVLEGFPVDNERDAITAAAEDALAKIMNVAAWAGVGTYEAAENAIGQRAFELTEAKQSGGEIIGKTIADGIDKISRSDISTPEGVIVAWAELLFLTMAREAFSRYTPGGGKENETAHNNFSDIVSLMGENSEALYAKVVDLFAGDDMPTLRAIAPTKHTMPNNALINTMQRKPAINAGEFDLLVSGEKGRRREITALAKVSYSEQDTGVKLTGANMTEYERQLSDGIITLWLYGHSDHIMTVDMIYRTMTGQTGQNVKAPEMQKKSIENFMRKWSSVRVTLDATEEMRKRGVVDRNGNPIKEFVLDEAYLNTRGLRIRAGDETVRAWQLLSKPVILKYSDMTGQLLTVPASLLNIREVTTGGKTSTVSISNNEGRISVKGYLLRNIEIMRGKDARGKAWSRTILFGKLFEEAGLASADKYAQKKLRDYAFMCLDYWKAEKYIKDYHIKKKGRAILGVEIAV